MSDELVVAEEPKALAIPSVLEIFSQLARDPSVEVSRIAQLMELHREAERWDAEKQFIAAKARLKFPPIKKTTKGQNSKYAPYEEIQVIIDPILDAEGFTLTFTGGEPTPQGMPIYGKLSHLAGHSEKGVLYLPRDKSGSMNEIQGVGSTVSYGQRYVAKMMLNLRFIGDDDDGGGYVDECGLNNIINMISECAMDDKQQAAFLKYMNVEKLDKIRQSNYPMAMTTLKAKLRRIQDGKR